MTTGPHASPRPGGGRDDRIMGGYVWGGVGRAGSGCWGTTIYGNYLLWSICLLTVSHVRDAEV